MHWPALTLAFVLVTALRALPAHACAQPSEEIGGLVEAGRFEEAEQRALAITRNAPGSFQAQLSLARLYLDWARRERVDVDFEALGIEPGETGTFAIEDPEEVFRFRAELQPERARQAAAVLERIVVGHPGRHEAHFCLIEIHQHLGDEEAYLGALGRAAQQLSREGTASPEDFLRFPRFFYERKQPLLAARSYEVLLESFPASAPLLSSHGAARVLAGDLEGGIAQFRRARELSPRDPIVLRNLASAAAYLGRLEEAESALRALAEVEPATTRLVVEIAVIATARTPRRAAAAWKPVRDRSVPAEERKWVEFGERLVAALESDPGDRVLIGAAGAVMRAEPRLAIELLNGIASRRPGDPAPHFLLAQGFELSELPEAAFASVRRAEERMPYGSPLLVIQPAALYYEAARLALVTERYPEAAAYLEKVRERDPARANLEYLLGMAYSALGDRPRARRHYAECLRRESDAEYAEHCRKGLERLAPEAQASAPAPR